MEGRVSNSLDDRPFLFYHGGAEGTGHLRQVRAQGVNKLTPDVTIEFDFVTTKTSISAISTSSTQHPLDD